MASSSLIRLYFGSSSASDDQQELNQEINEYLEETEMAKNRIQMLMQEMNKNASVLYNLIHTSNIISIIF